MSIKIVEMNAENAPSDDDLIVIRDNASQTTRKITRTTFLSNAYESLNPSGIITQYGGTSAPQGWLLCNGAAISRATYSALFSAIGTDWGPGDGSTTFNIPDIRGRVPVGKAASGTFGTLNNTGGAETHTLSSGEMPAHIHGASTTSGGEHAHNYTRWSAVIQNAVAATDQARYIVQGEYTSVTPVQGSHGHTISVTSAGGGGSHNNLQPYVVTNYIIKT